MLDTYLKLKLNKKGFGVYTTVNIPANTPIFEIKGDVLSLDEIKEKNDQKLFNNSIQIAQFAHISPSGGFADFINHSCNPNCKIVIAGKRAIVYSLYPIKANSELTYDYSSTDNSNPEEWSMQCECGEHNCRKNISGFQHLDKDLQKNYADREIAAIFLREPIFNRKTK